MDSFESVGGSPYLFYVAPYIDVAAGRTLAPLRFISEALGVKVEWVAATNQIIIRERGRKITLTIGSRDVEVDGQRMFLDTAPQLLGSGRTFIPLRFISEILGAGVYYDNYTGKITITQDVYNTQS